MVNAKWVADLLGPVSDVRGFMRRLRASSDIVAVKHGNTFVYPAFQFSTERREVKPAVAEANRPLRSAADPWGALAWWTAPNPRWGRRRPIEHTDDRRVVALAGAESDDSFSRHRPSPAIEPRRPARPSGHLDLPAGTVLYRVHRADRAAYAFDPTPRPPAPRRPGRRWPLDSIDGSYAYLYAALSEEGACESFVRDLDYARAGPRPLPWARVSGKVVSTVRTRRDVKLVEIQGAAAEQLGQDDWLTRCDEDAYPRSGVGRRRCGPGSRPRTLRPGLAVRRDPQQRVMVLWGEPAGAPTGCQVLEPEDGGAHREALDGGFGLVRLSAFLAPWRLYLER